MPNWNDQLNSYFLQASDITGDGEQLPNTSEGNLVQHFIDGHNYFGALRLEIETLLALARSDPPTGNDSDPFFYIIGWWLGLVDAPDQWVSVDPSVASAWRLDAPYLGSALRLEDGSPDPAPLLIDELEEMAAEGVDVRVLGWVSPLVLNTELLAERLKGHAFGNNLNTIRSIEEVRRRNGPGTATLMTLAHPLGSMHLKTIVAGTTNGMRAYVSGMDLQDARIADTSHTEGRVWHDAGVVISGRAAEAVYSFYRDLWNEQIDRPPDRFRLNREVVNSHFTTQLPSVSPPAITPPVSERHVPPPNTPGVHHVQVLRTIPRLSLLFGNPGTVAADFVERVLVLGTGRSPMSFAPNGLFEFAPALRHAIGAAEKYIYIEDQAFCAIEVMDWINTRMKAVADLKVILVWGRDPSDPPTPFPHQAISNTLIPGVTDADDRIRVFSREGIIVHSKITIVDDVWAAIGSANCLRRSLYTDGELSVSVMEDSPTPFAKVLRKDLWGELCNLAPGPSRDPLLDLDVSLAVIEPTWTAASPPPSLHLASNIVRMRLPFEYADPPGEGQWAGTGPPAFDQFEYDLKDPDSR
jgi:phosphatidylserine/phosphatidylglycerophosphate/cardiolipin synthase-like enzyme